MKVILEKDIDGLGKKYEVKEVPAGYARNFLLPKKLVNLATPEKLRGLEKLKEKLKKEEAELEKDLRIAAENIGSRELKISFQADENGKLFGSVTKDAILSALRDQGFVTRERVEIKMEHPLKELGVFEISIDLKKGITAKLKVIIERSPR
ncbi:MAG: 50S ribosomal protein L9 [Candidatus Paceibacterota bacterium]|jgi:large subunit ribosomal protein L9